MEANLEAELEIIIADDDDNRRVGIQSILAGANGKLVSVRLNDLDGILAMCSSNGSEPGVIILNGVMSSAAMDGLVARLNANQVFTNVMVIACGPAAAGTRRRHRLRQQLGENVCFATADSQPATELLGMVEMALVLKRERDLRHRQQEHLITELAERKIMEARLKYLVSHDELTGLANRRSLEKTIDLALYRCLKFNKCGALLYLDLDRFNIINDIEGYETGDRLLVDLVGLMRATLTADQYIARIGSDEFCIYLENINRPQAMATAERLRQAIDDFVVVTATEHYRISASIGVALLQPTQKILHPNEFIVQAHQACFVAKSHGRNTVHLFNDNDAELHARHHDAHWLPLIRLALLEDRFVLNFQPVVRLADGAVEHYEVLLRMRGPGGQLFEPERFVLVAERTGLITRIDLWVLDHAIDFLAALPDHQSHVSLNINLSGVAFQDSSLLLMLKKKLELSWINGSRLTFEITETAAIANLAKSRDMVARIRALGCRFAIDDFGSGFSSFHYLKHFQVDYLKIDGQFIRNLVNDETDQVLVRAMIDIARNLGKQTIAEFVDDVKILRLLREFKIDYVQGYLLGKPGDALLDTNVIPLDGLIDHFTPPSPEIATPR